MENFKRVARNLEVLPLLNAVKRKDFLWKEITARQDTVGSPHTDTQSIFLRGPLEQTVESIFNDPSAMNYPAMEQLTESHQLIHALADIVNAREIGRIMVVSLAPGGFITPHVDEGKYADHFERFHIILATNPDCWFQCNHDQDSAEFVRMKVGEAWWFNHKREHTFMNEGETPRIHLIADMVAPIYRKERDAIRH